MSLLPKSKIYTGESYHAVINADHVHNKNPIKMIGFSCQGLGVTVDLSAGSRDSVAKAVNLEYSK